MAIIKNTGVALRGALEQDALSGWRRLIRFRPGERKAAKTAFNRRIRRQPVVVDDEHDESE